MVMMTLTKEDYKKALEKICNSPGDKSIYLQQPYYLGFLHYNRLDLMDRADSIARKEDIDSFYKENLGINPSNRKNELKRFEYLETLNELIYHFV